MSQSICVVFDGLRAARDAYQSLLASGYAENAASIEVHYRRLIDGKLPVSQTRTREGALWGGLGMAVLGGLVTMLPFAFVQESGVSPWMGALLGVVFGGLFGGLAGMLIGTTDPHRDLAEVDPLLAEGRVALIAEFEDDEMARTAEQRLLSFGGAPLDPARA
jgi:hypothetical protein